MQRMMHGTGGGELVADGAARRARLPLVRAGRAG
jgi:hypothetical protein